MVRVGLPDSLPEIRRGYIHRDTLAAASAIYKGEDFLELPTGFSDFRPEMHGKEDGTIPATFQIIYMVCPTLAAPEPKSDLNPTDRMEALSKPTKASRKGICQEESQRCPLSLAGARSSPNTRSPGVHRDQGEMFKILPALVPLLPLRWLCLSDYFPIV